MNTLSQLNFASFCRENDAHVELLFSVKHGDGMVGFGLFDIRIDGNVTASVIRYTYF